MCKTCGCTPCKCGGKIVNGVCEGCGKPYDNCTCEKKQYSHQIKEIIQILAKKVNKSHWCISRIEGGLTKVSKDEKIKIAKALETEVKRIFP